MHVARANIESLPGNSLELVLIPKVLRHEVRDRIEGYSGKALIILVEQPDVIRRHTMCTIASRQFP
jgi:hypothetical protein